jgi:hypothetical protein
VSANSRERCIRAQETVSIRPNPLVICGRRQQSWRSRRR